MAPSNVDQPHDGTHGQSSDRKEAQLRALRFQEMLRSALAGCGTEQAMYSSIVHRVASEFQAQHVCLAAHEPVTDAMVVVHQTKSRREWEAGLFRRASVEDRAIQEAGVLIVPVHSGDALWGVLGLARTGVEDALGYSGSERQTVRAAAEILGDELQRRRQHLLDDVLDDLLRKTKPIDVYTHALRELRRFVKYDHAAAVMTMQRGTSHITVRVEKMVRRRGETETLQDSPRRGRAVRLTAGQARYLSRLQVPIALKNDGEGWLPGGFPAGPTHPDAAGLWRVFSHSDKGQGAILCYPLVFGGHTLGFLALTGNRASAFDPAQHGGRTLSTVLSRFARLLAVTLYRSEQYHQSDRQLQAVKEIGRAITVPMPVEEVCRHVLDLALRVLNVQVGVVGLLSDDRRLELVVHQGSTLATTPTLNMDEGVAGAVVRSGKPRAVPDVKREPAYMEFNGRVCSELIVPIVYDREVIGFLDVESFEEGRFRDEDEEIITFLEALANQAAIAIKTAQLRDEAMAVLGRSLPLDTHLSAAGFQDMLVEELRGTIDRLATANRAKSEFLAHMSHDLRGPLNVIVGLSNLLSDPAVSAGLDDEKKRESLELIRSNGEVLGALIGNILDLSAVEAGKVHLVVSTFEAQPAFEYLCAVAKTLATEAGKSLDISATIQPQIRTIKADEDKFLRVMNNLIANAVKFTPDGGRISVHAEISGEGDSLYVQVQDTGIGIPADDLARVFDPFQQVDGSAYRQYHGTGLGLAVVRQFVELHGGRVWVDSVEGTGSTFHVVMPGAVESGGAIEATTSAPVEVCEPERSGPDTSGGERGRPVVLVVEDIPAHANLMRLAITSRGYSMHGVGSGEDALEWLEDNRPDVILLDMELPGADGFTTAARIKGRVESQTTPIIAVTANALAISEERARASGCDAYLTKPIDIATLLATLDSVARRES